MHKLLNISIAVLLLAGTAAWGYWDTSMDAKWVQFPDEDPSTSLDVYASYEKTLADDFECVETGPITEVHIWGSWRQDVLPFVGPIPDPFFAGLVDFRLSIHADIPAADSPFGGLHPKT